MRYYMAYGSNLNKSQMRRRCPDAYPVGTCRLNNYQLVFRRGVLTIEPEQGSFVPVAVWAISRDDEKSLDRYEGFPHLYYKHEFPIVFSGESMGKATEIITDCMAYIMTDGYPIQEPSSSYLHTCLRGYQDFNLDPAPLMKALAESKGGDA